MSSQPPSSSSRVSSPHTSGSESSSGSSSSSLAASETESEDEAEDGTVKVYSVMLKTTDPGLDYRNPPTFTETQGVYFTWKEAKDAAKDEISDLGFDADEVLDDPSDDDYVDDREREFDVHLEGGEGETYNIYITMSRAPKAPLAKKRPAESRFNLPTRGGDSGTLGRDKRRKLEGGDAIKTTPPGSHEQALENRTPVYVVISHTTQEKRQNIEIQGLFWTWRNAKQRAMEELRKFGYEKEEDLDFEGDAVIDDVGEEFDVSIQDGEGSERVYITTKDIDKSA
ncbi:uncharacterized protein I303_101648 [Kwoniella dejecticola CBS 10117]|uniref:Uncharacterized protein n=1 Tax=Kwoniella dejecticola CBS 10117 TaxID=1296121 RepID=A0A1A6AD68_9TREE|nr:uncharacterized protein I303_02216 [Kwoniella dejecticola CBS 10117]OBR88000.1 hypothetical protein I303_02216 [Kwoniella dejecticola CBS 10117]